MGKWLPWVGFAVGMAGYTVAFLTSAGIPFALAALLVPRIAGRVAGPLIEQKGAINMAMTNVDMPTTRAMQAEHHMLLDRYASVEKLIEGGAATMRAAWKAEAGTINALLAQSPIPEGMQEPISRVRLREFAAELDRLADTDLNVAGLRAGLVAAHKQLFSVEVGRSVRRELIEMNPQFDIASLPISQYVASKTLLVRDINTALQQEMVNERFLAGVLVREGHVPVEDMQRVLDLQGTERRRLDELLIEQKLMSREDLDKIIDRSMPDWGTRNSVMFHRARTVKLLSKKMTKLTLSGRKMEKDAIDEFAANVTKMPWSYASLKSMLDLVEAWPALEKKINVEAQNNWPMDADRAGKLATALISEHFSLALTTGSVDNWELRERAPKIENVTTVEKNKPDGEPYYEVTGTIRSPVKGLANGSFSLTYNAKGEADLDGMKLDFGGGVMKKLADVAAADALGPRPEVKLTGRASDDPQADYFFEARAGSVLLRFRATADGFVDLSSMERTHG
jgi:hypothetical protein